MDNKNVYVIAGSNGSGKTTFAKKFLPDYAKCINFINADLIAHGLSPFSPEIAALKAGKLVLQQIKEYSSKGVDFSFETTLAGKSYIQIFKTLKKKGYFLHLFFLWIPSSELAIERIKERVSEGGHDVPSLDVRRRFRRGIKNFFEFYRPLLDSWILFDNSGSVPNLIVEERGNEILINNKDLYLKIVGGLS